MSWAVAGGGLIGLGLAVLAAELIPARIALAAVLDRIDGSVSVSTSPGALATVIRRIPVPAADLGLLGIGREAHIVRKAGFALAGLAAAPVLAAAASVVGLTAPVVLPAAGSVILAVVLFIAPDFTVRARASERRADFRHALTSYLDLVAMERTAGAAPVEALESAAATGHGWAFSLISDALERAHRTGAAPWDGLADLAERTGIRELGEVADIAGTAGQEGARIVDALAARAAAMRSETLADTRARAAARGTTMVIPIVLLATGFLLLLTFPVVYTAFSSGGP